MSELNDKEEIKTQKILVDIYKNENEQLKYEYRVLYDKYAILNNEYEGLNNKYELLNNQIEEYKNSMSYKISKRIERNVFYRILKKLKHRFSKKG